MNIQNNTSNTTAFQAKLIVRGSSVNSKRITNIQKIFENNTKKLNGTLYCNTLKKGKNAQDGFSTVTTETNRQYIFKDSLRVMLEKLTDNEIAKKFAKVFECIQKEARWTREESKLSEEIKNVSFLAEQNKLKATNSKESGFHKVAKMYDVISKRNFNRLEALKQEKNHKFDIYMENLKKIIDGDKDFNEYLQYIEVFLK